MPDKHEVGGSSPLGPTSANAQRALAHKHRLKRVVLPCETRFRELKMENVKLKITDSDGEKAKPKESELK